MAQKSFSTSGTKTKLDTLEKYMSFYTSALGTRFHLTYFDAFAGTGDIPLGEPLPLFDGLLDVESVIEGSVTRALNLPKPFNRYILVDKRRANIRSLEALKESYADLSDRIQLVKDDANVAIAQFCDQDFRPKSGQRAIIFLDPFGNQVGWETLEKIAQTPGIDLWYLFPSGLGVTRQLSNDGRVQKDAKASLDRLFGTDSWEQDLIVEETKEDMFDGDRLTRRKEATAADVTRYMIGRMKSIFPDRVLDRWLPLGQRNGHWYSLIFAWSNPGQSASSLARRVSSGIMRRK